MAFKTAYGLNAGRPRQAQRVGDGAVHIVVLGVIARLHGFILRLVKHIQDEILIVVGTSSSETVLPRMIAKLENLGCSKSVVGLVIPSDMLQPDGTRPSHDSGHLRGAGDQHESSTADEWWIQLIDADVKGWRQLLAEDSLRWP
jgi:hypothetical protein